MLITTINANIYKSFGGKTSMMKQEIVKILKDPEQIDLFENPNYSRIVSILRRGELTIKEIHTLFNKDYEDKKTLTSIYRYMETLLENDLVFVSKEELMKGHLIERYYSRTALVFLFEDKKAEDLTINAASELLQKIYSLDTKRAEEFKKLLGELGRDMGKGGAKFLEKYGEEIFGLEKKYGFKAVTGAAKQFHQLLYYRDNPEMIDKIFAVLEG
jgi:Fe2+ or Zn2+ uptake regulation protein